MLYQQSSDGSDAVPTARGRLLDALHRNGDGGIVRIAFEAVPGAKLVMIDGVGHSPMVETPDKTFRLIEEFILGRMNEMET